METNYTPPNEMPERPMYKVLAGQHALVTGASKGLGAGAAIALATAGTDVLVNYRSDRDGTDTVVKEITAMGRRAFSFKADVSQEHEVLAMFADKRSASGTFSARGCRSPNYAFRDIASQAQSRPSSRSLTSVGFPVTGSHPFMR